MWGRPSSLGRGSAGRTKACTSPATGKSARTTLAPRNPAAPATSTRFPASSDNGRLRVQPVHAAQELVTIARDLLGASRTRLRERAPEPWHLDRDVEL